MTHREISKTRRKTLFKLLLGRRVSLPAIADFDSCEPILFKANKKTKTVRATFINRKGLNKLFIQSGNSTWTILVSHNQIARLEEDNVRTESPLDETISQSEPQVRYTDVAPSRRDEASAATSTVTKKNPSYQSFHKHQQETENNPTDLENLYTQFSIKKEEGCDGFEKTSRSLEIFSNKVS